MKELKIIDVVPSRFETTGKRLIAGMSDRYTFETNEGIPAGKRSSHTSVPYPARPTT